MTTLRAWMRGFFQTYYDDEGQAERLAEETVQSMDRDPDLEVTDDVRESLNNHVAEPTASLLEVMRDVFDRPVSPVDAEVYAKDSPFSIDDVNAPLPRVVARTIKSDLSE